MQAEWLKKLLQYKEVIKTRITTAELDKLAEEFIINKVLSHLLRVIVDFQRPYVHLLMMKWFMEFHPTGFYLKET
jgi:hypothetical protein